MLAAVVTLASMAPAAATAAQVPPAGADQPRSPLVKSLLQALGESPQQVEAAAEQLATPPGNDELAAEAAAAIEAAWLSRKDADWTRNAIHALEQWSGQNQAAARVLLRLLDDDRPAIRQAAMDAAIRSEAVADPRILPLMAALRHAEPAERYRAAGYLAKFGEHAAPAVGALVRAAQDDTSHAALRWEAVFALRDIGPAGVAGLVEVLKSTERSVAYKALDSLAQLGPKADAAYEAVAEILLHHDDPRARSRAAAVLKNMPERAAESIALLRRASHDPDQHVRDAAVQALEQFQRSAGR